MLSSSDIRNFFKKHWLKNPDIITYQEINENMLNESNDYCCFILYETSPRIGHWTVLFYNEPDNIVEFFDPYGIIIDDQLQWTYYTYPKKYLIDLFIDSNQPFEVNNIQFQKFDKNIETCGKWCCLRILFCKDGFTKKDFDDYFNNLENPDQIVNELYSYLSY